MFICGSVTLSRAKSLVRGPIFVMLNRAIFKRKWREHPPRTQVPGWTNDANGVLFLSFFLIYIFTLSPDVLPADAGEFQAVVPLLGVAHPPGFPLYILLGKAFLILFPFLTPARALNLFSALTGALTSCWSP